MRDQLVVILGMHRSGTSLVTSNLPLLGFPLGDNLMKGNADNPKGFFEDLDVVSLNDELLTLNYSSWDSPLLNMDREIRFTVDHEKRAKKLLELRLAETGKWVMKDPRLCLIMPFWRAQFEATNVRPHYVGVYRDPLAIAASLQKRNQLDRRHSLLLCYLYMRSIMDALGNKAFVISYDKFVDEPNLQLARLASHIEVEMIPDALEPRLQRHVDPSLRHHRNLSGELFPALEQLSQLMMDRALDRKGAIQYPVGQELEDQQLEKELLAIQVRRDFDDRADLSSQKQRLEADKKLLQSDLADNQSRLVEREKHVSLLEQETARLGTELQTSGAILAERDDQIQKLHVLMGTLQVKLNQRNDEIRELGRHLKDFDRIHLEVLRSVSFRLGRILTFPIRKLLNFMLLNRLEADSFWRNIIGFLRNCVSHPVAALKLVSLARLRNFYLVLAKRRDLAEQVVANYEEMMFQAPVERLAVLQQYSASELQDYRLTLKTSSEPLVSVLIPVYNQLDHTLQCLESIAEHPPLVPFEVIIANDCSTDLTAEVVGRVEGVRLINNKENLKFLQNCNCAADCCKGEFIFLLNNDTVVKSGWLDMLLDVFESRPDAGLVGSKLVYPDGRLQEAGGIVWSDGSAWNFGRLQDPKLPEYNYLREVDYVSGAAVMIKRQLFEDLGRFDTLFEPAYYEDTDLAFKVRAAGSKVYYQPRSEIVHYEGISHGTDESMGIKRHQSKNRQQFVRKWQSVLLEQHFSNGECLFKARDRSRDKISVLVVDHYVPHFDKDAGSRSTFLYLKLLSEAGCQVKFMGDNFYQHEPYTGILQNIGIEVLHGRYYQKYWKSWLQKHAAEIDVIYIMRPHIAEKYIDTINKMEPKPRTIYFGHDLHFLRLRRQAEITKDPALADEAAEWQHKEFELFHKVDRIYYPSEVEVEEIKNMDPNLPVKSIPLYPISEFDQSPVDFLVRQGLLFVGGFNHPPNTDGLMWFVDQVLPQLDPDIRLNIVGSNMSSQIQNLDSDQIVVHGFLSDEDLDELYGTVSLAIVPLRFGAGIKGKVLEAMNRGVPVVTTSIGAEGIPSAADVLLVADDAEAMARQIDMVTSDRELLNKYSKLGREAVQRHFGTESALSTISEDFFLKP